MARAPHAPSDAAPPALLAVKTTKTAGGKKRIKVMLLPPGAHAPPGCCVHCVPAGVDPASPAAQEAARLDHLAHPTPRAGICQLDASHALPRRPPPLVLETFPPLALGAQLTQDLTAANVLTHLQEQHSGSWTLFLVGPQPDVCRELPAELHTVPLRYVLGTERLRAVLVGAGARERRLLKKRQDIDRLLASNATPGEKSNARRARRRLEGCT